MENLQKYKNQIKEVESLVIKLENGALSIEELSTLESLTRAIHERSIILKYKAFEQKVNPVVSTEEPAAEVSEPKVEAEKKEVVEEPTIDFSMFSVEEEEEAPIQEDIKVEAEPEIIPEPTVEKVDPIVVELKEEAPVSQPGTSFLDRIQSADTSLNARFNGTKLDTLVGAFGLNQKLMYINELFDGSSESFSDAIKSLDSKSSMEDAKETVTALASKFEWDAEEESVIEFMAVLNRRYA
jgi:exonuclease VII small subunit